MHVMLDMNKIITINRLDIGHINNYIHQKLHVFSWHQIFIWYILFYLLKTTFMLVTLAEKKISFLSSLSIEFFFPQF